MVNAPAFHTDRNVYILGAGFSVDGGLPLIANFMTRMRESVEWLTRQGRTREAEAIANVLDFRLRASSAAYRVSIDPDNIEDLFSLASAVEGKSLSDSVTTAISATLDFAHTGAERNIVVCYRKDGISECMPLPRHWSIVTDQDRFSCPVYDYYVGAMTGMLRASCPTPAQAGRNTIITFNYDLLVETALQNLGIPYSYGMRRDSVVFDESARDGWTDDSGARLEILKLHGSVNWVAPNDRRSHLTLFKSYNEVCHAQEVPLLIPPSWNKVFTDELSQVWDRSVQALATATRIVMIGFAMRPADTHFKYLLAAGLQRNISLQQIIFVNPLATKLERSLLQVFRQRAILKPLDMKTHQFLCNPDSLVLLNRRLSPPFHVPTPPPWA